MYPIDSNGASQAILDAEALAEAVSSIPDVPKALERYEGQRLAPTSAIVHTNLRLGPEIVMHIVEDRVRMASPVSIK